MWNLGRLVCGKPGMPEGLGPNPQSYDTSYSQSLEWGPQGFLGQFQEGQTGQNHAQSTHVSLHEAHPHLCCGPSSFDTY